jgi:hypothetical protein
MFRQNVVLFLISLAVIVFFSSKEYSSRLILESLVLETHLFDIQVLIHILVRHFTTATIDLKELSMTESHYTFSSIAVLATTVNVFNKSPLLSIPKSFVPLM